MCLYCNALCAASRCKLQKSHAGQAPGHQTGFRTKERLLPQFKSYQLAVYLYSFSSFLDVMLIENFKADNLKNVSQKISDHSRKYILSKKALSMKRFSLSRTNSTESTRIKSGSFSKRSSAAKTHMRIPSTITSMSSTRYTINLRKYSLIRTIYTLSRKITIKAKEQNRHTDQFRVPV